MRLTDERDMVFLYHMRMTEEEYRWYGIPVLLSLSLFSLAVKLSFFRVVFSLAVCNLVVPISHITLKHNSDLVQARGLWVNGFCYPTRPMAKSLLPDPIRTSGLITRPDLNPWVWVGSGKPMGTGVPRDLY